MINKLIALDAGHGMNTPGKRTPLYEDVNGNLITPLVQCMMPLPYDVSEPFWIESAQLIITGIMLHYFEEGYEFNEIIESLVNILLLGQIHWADNGNSDTAKMLVAQPYRTEAENKAEFAPLDEFFSELASDEKIRCRLQELIEVRTKSSNQ